MLVALVALVGCSGPVSPPSETTPQAVETGLTRSERAQAVASCLERDGWDVTYDPGAEYYDVQFPTEQTDAFDASEQACLSAHQGISEPEVTEEFIADMYQQQLDTAECLAELGASVEEPPTLQSYRDSFDSDQWTAYGATEMTYDEFQKYEESCPQPG